MNVLIDIISSLSLASISVLVETYRFHKEEIEQNVTYVKINESLSQQLKLSEKDLLSHWYLLSGKGLLEQQPLHGKGFMPFPSSWLKDIIHILEVENHIQ